MKGQKTGGRQKGTKNKATLEREQRVLDELRGKAARLVPQLWAKDALEDLVPEALELMRAVKGVVARLQARAYKQLEGDGPITDGKTLDKLKEWTSLLKDAQAAASLIMSRAGEFQSPKLQRIDGTLLLATLASQQKPAAAQGDDNVHYIDDPNAASRLYQRTVQRIQGAA